MANEAMQDEIDHVLAKFSGELLKLFQKAVLQTMSGRGATLPAASPRKARAPKGAPVAKAAKPAKRGRGGPKSSPVEVTKLGDKLVEILKRRGEPVPAKELLKASGAESGQFHYALSKAKADGRISQLGERRMARYEVGNGKAAGKKSKPAKAKGKPGRKPGRKPAAPAAAPEAAEATSA